MATLTPTLTLASTDALSDAINFSVTDTLALTDYGKLRKHVVISPNDVDPGADGQGIATDGCEVMVFEA